MDTNAIYTLNRGDVVEIVTSGGGGFGDPLRRPMEKVVQEVRDGIGSISAAREAYGVVVDPTSLKIDHKQTARLRG